MLQDPNEEIRAVAARVAGGPFGDPRQREQLAPQLTPLLRDPSPLVRAAAVDAVGHVAEAVPAVVELFGDKNAEVRARAAWAVPAVAAAVPGVIELLKDGK